MFLSTAMINSTYGTVVFVYVIHYYSENFTLSLALYVDIGAEQGRPCSSGSIGLTIG